jgi:hypothetical protein
MRALHRTAATLALLIAAAPAAAIDIVPSLLAYASESQRVPGTPLIEFDRDDWAAFIGSEAPRYQLPALAELVATTAPPPSDSNDSIVSQVWERR